MSSQPPASRLFQRVLLDAKSIGCVPVDKSFTLDADTASSNPAKLGIHEFGRAVTFNHNH
jgi:hypothetical protein